MSGSAKVVIVDSDPIGGAQLAWAFANGGLVTAVERWDIGTPTKGSATHADGSPSAAVIVARPKHAGTKHDELLGKVAEIRGRYHNTPVLVVGEDLRRVELDAAGVLESITHPLFVRDVPVLVDLVVAAAARKQTSLSGNLGDTASVYRLLRSLCSLGRSGVLSLMRGLRRGEVRIYHGEITSATVGLNHGQSALHQMLLWTDAKFEFRREDIVRRQQIPLSRKDLFIEAQRFLDRLQQASGGLSPADRLSRNEAKLAEVAGDVPGAINDLLRLFDGNRTLADIFEDSPYRLFETLRVTLRAVEVEILKQAGEPKQKTTWHAVLAVEEWLVGVDKRTAQDRVHALASDAESGKFVAAAVPAAHGAAPATTGTGNGSATSGSKKKKRDKRKHRQGNATSNAAKVSSAISRTVTWGDLLPRESSAELESVSQVVPVFEASGEIAVRDVAASRDSVREGLESALDHGERQRVFVEDLVGSAAPAPEVSGEIPLIRVPKESQQFVASSASVLVAEGFTAETFIGEPARSTPAVVTPVTASASANHAGTASGTSAANIAADSKAAASNLMKAAAAQAAAPATQQPKAEAQAKADAHVLAIARDAKAVTTQFTDEEEQFFAAASKSTPVAKVEVFEDLDEGYVPQSFWQRLRGKSRPPGSE